MRNSCVNFLVKIPILCWDINKTRQGVTFLPYPVEQRMDYVEYFLYQQRQVTPLWIAAHENYLKVVRTLIQHDADCGGQHPVHRVNSSASSLLSDKHRHCPVLHWVWCQHKPSRRQWRNMPDEFCSHFAVVPVQNTTHAFKIKAKNWVSAQKQWRHSDVN